MKKIKDFLSGLFYLFTAFIMWFPFFCIRFTYLKLVLNQISWTSMICRNVDIRKPKHIRIGQHTTINKNVVLDGRGGELIIGNNVDIAQDVKIWTLQHNYNSPDYSAQGKTTIIEDYVWIASGATILPGIRIRKGAVIASGAIVTKDVDEFVVVAGNPAKVIGQRNHKLRYQLGFHWWFR